MNDKIEMKKKLLKQALSKNQPRKQESEQQKIIGKILQSKKTQQQPFQSFKKLSIAYVKKASDLDANQRLIRIDEEISSIDHDDSMYNKSENFSQKSSHRSSFSQSLHTDETDNIKMLISKFFENKTFIQQVQSALLDQKINLKAKQQIIDIKSSLLTNQVFVFSLEARLKQKKSREKQDLVEREVKKKIITQIILNQNQKECYNAEKRIQYFLCEKLSKIKRKEY